ncbi:hypothetical protein J2I47_15605 [Fibrella sp. HMF5335]|uniref:Uncharacterized protein n=1 Tax=Fibrella rubiginis TaxID=2817060 RepID=A0A939GK87_9BACT|nr:hypothetical protein [Fibrella rubiginis]MBO0937982.1 hypothetical protein [Fibrella rubiginis]
MTTLVLPIELEPGVVISIFDFTRQLNDDQFYDFCQANANHFFERDAFGNLLLVAPSGGEKGAINCELVAELII